VTSIDVKVAGCRGGTGPLTWGQRSILNILRMRGPEAWTENLGAWADLPRGTDLAGALARITQVLSLHDALRTRITDADAAQTVDPAGVASVEIVDTDDRPLDDAADEVVDRLKETRFALADEWPVRFAVLLRAGAAVGVAYACSHVVGDARARHLLTAALENPPADAGVQPLDQAAWEASPPGLAAGARSAAYWRAQLTAMPATLFPAEPGVPDDGYRFWYARFVSPLVTTAASLVAHRQGVSTSSVLYAALAAALTAATGADRCPMGTVAANRTRAGTQAAVGSFAQLVPITFDVADRPFGELVGAAAAANLTALRRGAYDPAMRAAVTQEVELARGTALDLSLWFNDARVDAGAAGPGAAPDRQRGRAEWVHRARRGDSTVFVYVSGSAGGTVLDLMVDTCRLSRGAAEQLLADVETVLADAADGAASTGTSAVDWRTGPDLLPADERERG
jgi:hypothetical protein